MSPELIKAFQDADILFNKALDKDPSPETFKAHALLDFIKEEIGRHHNEHRSEVLGLHDLIERLTETTLPVTINKTPFAVLLDNKLVKIEELQDITFNNE